MGFPGGTVVKNLPVNVGDTGDEGLITGWEDPLEQDMATDSSILAWKMPWTEKSGELQSMGSQRVRHNRVTKTFTFHTITGTLVAYIIMFSSVAQSCLTLCNPIDFSTPGFPVHHQLPELAQTHVR